jgi:hypothetical protein
MAKDKLNPNEKAKDISNLTASGRSPKDPEVVSMLQKMYEMKKDLERQLNHLYDLGKIAKVDIDRYFGYRFNLSPKEIALMHEFEKKIAEKVDQVILPESCIKRLPTSDDKITQELTQKRKGKTRGSRKKWLPIP